MIFLGQEILRPLVLRADETPHRMLEGVEIKKSLFVGGFNAADKLF